MFSSSSRTHLSAVTKEDTSFSTKSTTALRPLTNPSNPLNFTTLLCKFSMPLSLDLFSRFLVFFWSPVSFPVGSRHEKPLFQCSPLNCISSEKSSKSRDSSDKIRDFLSKNRCTVPESPGNASNASIFINFYHN